MLLRNRWGWPPAGVLLLALGGCGTVMTRPFEPLTTPPGESADAAFADAFDGCVYQVSGMHAVGYGGQKTSSGVGMRGTAAGGTVAMGVATGIGGYAGLGVAVVALPVALGYGATRGISVLNRDNKEKEVQDAVTGCMTAKGFHIVGWRMVSPGETAGLTTPVAKPSALKPGT